MGNDRQKTLRVLLGLSPVHEPEAAFLETPEGAELYRRVNAAKELHRPTPRYKRETLAPPAAAAAAVATSRRALWLVVMLLAVIGLGTVLVRISHERAPASTAVPCH